MALLPRDLAVRLQSAAFSEKTAFRAALFESPLIGVQYAWDLVNTDRYWYFYHSTSGFYRPVDLPIGYLVRYPVLYLVIVRYLS
jgi:hypothetical protein